MGYDQEAAAMTPLASLSITHVYYDPNDRVSLLCAYLALVPQALGVVYLTLAASSREAEVLLALAGQVACEALNFALKRLIKQDRPRLMLSRGGTGYGMPSSHAQFVAFWSVSLVLFLLVRHRPTSSSSSSTTTTTTTKHTTTTNNNNNNNNSSTTTTLHIALAATSLLLAAATACSRVYLNYHSPPQVLVGSLTGALFALVWFRVVSALRSSGLLAWALDRAPVRALRIRDLVVHEDLSQAGWEKWEARRMANKKNK